MPCVILLEELSTTAEVDDGARCNPGELNVTYTNACKKSNHPQSPTHLGTRLFGQWSTRTIAQFILVSVDAVHCRTNEEVVQSYIRLK